MNRDWRHHRDESVLSTKAGYDMWAGPYGFGGSRKYLVSSFDQSLKRMRVDYPLANALQCDANQLLADVLDVTTTQESGSISRKLKGLPAEEQRRILQVLEVMIDER